MDCKYDILKHPNVALTTDGKGEDYVHGFSDQSVLEFKMDIEDNKTDVSDVEDANIVIYSNEEIEEFLMKLEEKEYEKNQ